jgi:hypothetical protein
MFAKESEVSLWELNHQKDRVLLRKGVFFDHPAAGGRMHSLITATICASVFSDERHFVNGVCLLASLEFLALQQSTPAAAARV